MVDFSKHNKKSKGSAAADRELFNGLTSPDKENISKEVVLTTGTYIDPLEGLNEQQAAMVTGVINYVKKPGDKKFFTVQGGGGTGKSFSIIRALQGYSSKAVMASAPSHFAKNVLSDFLGRKYEVTTVASLLGKKVTYNDYGKEILVRINTRIPPPITKYPIILIDEGSMVDDETASEIIEYCQRGNRRLIVLGDYCQLPPVEQSEDSLFFKDISAELVIPMRFKGPIYDLTMLVRGEILKIRAGIVPSLNILNIGTDRASLLDESGSGYIFLNSASQMIKAAIRRFKKKKGTGYVRLLAYRNTTIDKLNRQVRIGLYGDSPTQFEEGELLINKGGFSKGAGNSSETIITNGELFKVKTAVPVIGPYDVPCIELTFEDEDLSARILAVADEGQELYDHILSDLTSIARKNKYMWRDVASFKESFAYFNYSYATSVHKSQGSSICHVFILEDDILEVKPTSTKEKLQSIYVAISRSSYRAYVYNKAYKVNNSNLRKELLLKDVE